MKKSLLYIVILSLIMLSENKEVPQKTFILKEEKTGTIIMGTHSQEKNEEEEEKNKMYYIPNIILPIKDKKPPRPQPRPRQSPSQK